MEDIAKTKMINHFLSNRPETLGIFGYGSGITKQAGYGEKDNPQIDLIVVAQSDRLWHEENMKLNPNDYSFTGKLFFTNASDALYHYGSDICYIPNIKYFDQTYKVGVVSKGNLINDLLYWKNFYLAGRFQKPMLTVKTDEEIEEAISVNRRNALVVGLLLLDRYYLKNLYMKICSLSYMGDTRMGIAENPNKISNIVEGSFSVFDEMYKQYDLFDRYYGNQMIDFNVADISDDIKNLPLHIMKPSRNNRYSRDELVMIMKSIVYQLETKNKNASLKQTLKGILTSGPSKSVNYAYQKVAKRFRSK